MSLQIIPIHTLDILLDIELNCKYVLIIDFFSIKLFLCHVFIWYLFK